MSDSLNCNSILFVARLLEYRISSDIECQCCFHRLSGSAMVLFDKICTNSCLNCYGIAWTAFSDIATCHYLSSFISSKASQASLKVLYKIPLTVLNSVYEVVPLLCFKIMRKKKSRLQRHGHQTDDQKMSLAA